jgi:hypothetical protein
MVGISQTHDTTCRDTAGLFRQETMLISMVV